MGPWGCQRIRVGWVLLSPAKIQLRGHGCGTRFCMSNKPTATRACWAYFSLSKSSPQCGALYSTTVSFTTSIVGIFSSNLAQDQFSQTLSPQLTGLKKSNAQNQDTV